MSRQEQGWTATWTTSPQRPSALDPAHDSGDHLHPDDAGYQAMANAIDLTLL